MDASSSATSRPQTRKRSTPIDSEVSRHLNLKRLRARAVELMTTIRRIIDAFKFYQLTGLDLRRQDLHGQFSMINMELFNIIQEFTNVSKAFSVYPKNLNAQNEAILPVMLSTKLLPEIEAENETKEEQVLCELKNLSEDLQIEKLKARIDSIEAACEVAEKVIADCRREYGLVFRKEPTLVSTVSKQQTEEIQEEERFLRAAVNFGEGLKPPADQMQLPSSLPSHLSDLLNCEKDSHLLDKNIGLQTTCTPSPSYRLNLQAIKEALLGKSVPSSSGSSFPNNISARPVEYADSSRSSTNLLNALPPQLLTQHLQQRQKLSKLLRQQQRLLAQRPMSQSSSIEGPMQGAISQLHDVLGQNPQSFQQVTGQSDMQFSQPISHTVQNPLSYERRVFSSAAQTLPIFQTFPLTSEHQERIFSPQIDQGNILDQPIEKLSSGGVDGLDIDDWAKLLQDN